MLLYEHFAAEPEATLARVFERLKLRRHRPVDFAAPSVSTDPAVFAAYGSTPSERWRDLLSRADADRIESIVDALYPDWRVDLEGGPS